MPVRKFTETVLRWPDAKAVDAAVRAWAEQAAREHPGTLRIGYPSASLRTGFGSYARGDWGVGSDVDLVAVVRDSDKPSDLTPGPFPRREGGLFTRALEWDATRLPVPADLLVYTDAEWQALQASGTRMARVLREEAVWVWEQ